MADTTKTRSHDLYTVVCEKNINFALFSFHSASGKLPISVLQCEFWDQIHHLKKGRFIVATCLPMELAYRTVVIFLRFGGEHEGKRETQGKSNPSRMTRTRLHSLKSAKKIVPVLQARLPTPRSSYLRFLRCLK